jgi:hypothetical protein
MPIGRIGADTPAIETKMVSKKRKNNATTPKRSAAASDDEQEQDQDNAKRARVTINNYTSKTVSADHFDEINGYLKTEFGLTEEQLAEIFQKRANFYSLSLTKLKEKLKYLEDHGIEREAISDVLARLPHLLSCSFENVIGPNVRVNFNFGRKFELLSSACILQENGRQGFQSFLQDGSKYARNET